MTNSIEATQTVSRPKIYRLPDEPRANTRLYITRTLVILCIMAMVVIVIPNMIAGKKPVSIPEISTDALAANQAGELTKSIRVGDESSQIIGQITKLPGDKEQQATISSSNKIDNNSGKELLRIISQY